MTSRSERNVFSSLGEIPGFSFTWKSQHCTGFYVIEHFKHIYVNCNAKLFCVIFKIQNNESMNNAASVVLPLFCFYSFNKMKQRQPFDDNNALV